MRWTLRRTPNPEDQSVITRLAAEARLSPAISALLVTRGIRQASDAHRFFHPEFAHLHSPYDMLGMKRAVERLRAAIAGQEKILIYGDYDVDGTTAVVILKTAIELCGGAAEYHVPHRVREGYGMRDEVLERAAGAGVRLIISVDTGIRAFAAAETARRLGLDLIVTDHHLPDADGLPHALAVLNPNQSGCGYPCKALCGAGVAFKLAHAVMEQAGQARLLPSFLKIVAIATIADAVPLVGENRVFAKLGLEGLRNPVNAGLRALLEVSAVNGHGALSSGDVAFRLAPRLNAAGRMDVAKDVIDLFTVRDRELARQIADRLNHLNAERQQEEQRILKAVDEQLQAAAAQREAWCIVVDGEGWHKGVIGIAATRVVERYGRPALVITREGDEAQGSGRSIEAFHLLEALESCSELFTRFGGHAHAAGFALPSGRIPELRARLDAWARAHLSAADLERQLAYDAEADLDQITPEFFQLLRRMEPFGAGNPQPVFVARCVRLLQPPRIMKEKHVKLRVRQSTALRPPEGGFGPVPRTFDAVGWRMAERLQQDHLLAGDLLDIAFTVEENSHPDFGGLQLTLCDVVRAEPGSKQQAASS